MPNNAPQSPDDAQPPTPAADDGQRRGIGRGFLAGAFGIFGSRVSGLLRDMFFASVFGTGAGSGLAAFLLAFTLPNLARRFLGEGALTDAFVPVLNERLEKGGEQSAFELVNRVLSWVATVLGVIVIIVGLVAWFIAPRMVDPLWRETLRLTPFILPYAVFICIAAQLGGVLNTFGRFALPAWGAISLNLCLIIATLSVAPRLQTPAWALVAAVIIAGLLQIAVMLPPLLKLGWRPAFLTDFQNPELRRVLALMAPGLLGAAAYQVNVLADRVFAAWLGDYAVTSLYYAERLVFLPVGIFAVALTTAALPVMSRAWSREDHAGMQDAFAYSMRHVLYLSAPCVLGLFLLAEPIVSLLFQRGKFDAQSLVYTSQALIFYAVGIPAFAALKIVRAGFFARQDTRTPVRIAVVCILLNILMNAIFIGPLQQRGLALATAISNSLNFLTLAYLLSRDVTFTAAVKAELRLFALRLTACLGAAGLVIWALSRQFPVGDTLTSRALAVFVPLIAGAIAYNLAAIPFRATELRELLATVRRKRG